MFKYLVPSWWYSLGRVRRYSFIGGGVSLEVNFEISKDHFIASYPSHPYCSSLMLADQDVSFQLLLQCHALSLAAILPTMIVMKSNLLKLLAPNKLFL